jgi:hypothetical protein
MKTVGGTVSNLQDAMTAFKVAIGEAGLNAALIKLVRTMITMVNTSDSLAQKIGKQMAASVNRLQKVMELLAKNSEAAAIAMKALFAAIAIQKIVALTAAVKGLVVTLGGAALAFKGFGLSALKALGPAGLIAVGILALLGALFAFRKEIGAFADKFAKADSLLGDLARTINVFRDELGPTLREVIVDLGKSIALVAKSVAIIIRTLIKILAAILKPVLRIVSVVLKIGAKLIAAVIKIAAAVLKPVGKVVSGIGMAAGGILAIAGSLIDKLLNIIGMIVNPFLEIIDMMVAGLSSGLDKAGRLFDGFVDKISDIAGQVFKPIQEAWDEMVSVVKAAILKAAIIMPPKLVEWAGGTPKDLEIEAAPIEVAAGFAGFGGGGFTTPQGGVDVQRFLAPIREKRKALEAAELKVQSLTVNVGGTTNMGPQDLQKSVREGTRKGMVDASEDIRNFALGAAR